MSKYFDENGYFLADKVMADDHAFIFILGGRGTGKTYSATRWLCEHCNSEHKFIFMRRTDNEIKFINTGNIYAEHHGDIKINTKGQFARVYRKVNVDGENKEDIIGYHLALSTIHNIRGFAMTDVDYILFDEFIAERGTIIRKYAGEQMLNAYETINRNRELKGKKPVKCIFLSNFNTAESDIMSAFGYTDELYKMHDSKPIGVIEDDYKKLIMINDSPISNKKAHTVLYEAARDRNFQAMAIENQGLQYIMPIKHYGRNGYDFMGTLGKININKLYSGYYYITEAAQEKDITRKDLLKYLHVYHSYMLGNLTASSQYAAALFTGYYEK